MRISKLLPLVLLLVTAQGCALYSVREHGAEDRLVARSGIPFYIRKAMCEQETVYQEAAFRVAITLDTIVYNGQTVTSRNPLLTVVRTVPATAEVGRVLAALSRMKVEHRGQFTAATQALSQRPRSAAADTMLVSNTVRLKDFVDYSQRYYLNVRRAWNGASSATVKLNPDGTLGEAAAEVDDQTLTTALGAIPLHDFLLDRLDLRTTEDADPAAGLPSARGPSPYGIRIEVKPAAFTHTLTERFALVSAQGTDSLQANRGQRGSEQGASERHPCAIRAPISFGRIGAENTGYALSVTVPGEGAAASATPANAVTVAGTITLPEPTTP